MEHLQYHPLANEYPLLEGAEYEEFRERVRSAGMVRENIVIFEGKILDGRNRYRAGMDLGLPVPARDFDPEEEGDPADFVFDANDARRHEEAEVRKRRKAARVERVKQKREAGESLRQIAEEEEISVPQVRRDLEDTTVPGGGTVEPKEGKVKGKDGRTRTATPKKPAVNGSTVPGGGTVENENAEPEESVDALGLPVSLDLREVFAARELFAEAERLRRGLAAVLDRIAKSPGGVYLAGDLSRRVVGGTVHYRSTRLEDIKTLLDGCRPHACVCPWCNRAHPGRTDKNCQGCMGQGWVPLRSWKQAPADDREDVERLVPR